jgi:hypothetical protein
MSAVLLRLIAARAQDGQDAPQQRTILVRVATVEPRIRQHEHRQ